MRRLIEGDGPAAREARALFVELREEIEKVEDPAMRAKLLRQLTEHEIRAAAIVCELEVLK